MIRADLRPVRHPVPRLGLRPGRHVGIDRLSGEELSVAVLDRLPRLAVQHLNRVVDVLPSMRRRVVRLDDVRVALRHLAQRRRPALAPTRRQHRHERDRSNPSRSFVRHPAPHGASLLLVVLQPEMRDLFLTHQMPKRVLELRLLDEKIVFRLESGSGHRRLVIEA